MHKPDFEPFRTMLDSLAQIFGKPKPDDLKVQTYWRALRDLPIELVQRGVEHHTRYGKFFPKPVELRPRDEKPGSGPASDAALKAAAATAHRAIERALCSEDRLARAKANDAILSRRLVLLEESHPAYPETKRAWLAAGDEYMAALTGRR